MQAVLVILLLSKLHKKKTSRMSQEQIKNFMHKGGPRVNICFIVYLGSIYLPMFHLVGFNW